MCCLVRHAAHGLSKTAPHWRVRSERSGPALLPCLRRHLLVPAGQPVPWTQLKSMAALSCFVSIDRGWRSSNYFIFPGLNRHPIDHRCRAPILDHCRAAGGAGGLWRTSLHPCTRRAAPRCHRHHSRRGAASLDTAELQAEDLPPSLGALELSCAARRLCWTARTAVIRSAAAVPLNTPLTS